METTEERIHELEDKSTEFILKYIEKENKNKFNSLIDTYNTKKSNIFIKKTKRIHCRWICITINAKGKHQVEGR